MKKGFTLIELMAVIVLLAVIAVIAFPIVNNSLNDSKIKTCQNQKKTIIETAKRWVADHSDEIKSEISVTELKDSGYLSKENKIINPTDNKEMTGNVKITYDNDYKQYEYTYNISCELK